MTAVRQMTSRRDVVPAVMSAVGEMMARRGPCAIVLRAAAGAGKSHLLRELVDELTIPVRSASATEPSVTEPFSLAASLLDPDPPARPPARYDEILLGYFDDLVARGPIVLTIDDVHFADAESLSVLDQVLDAARSVPAALVATVRETKVRDEVSRLAARPGVSVWDLPPFDLLDLDALVHQHTGAWPGPGVRALVAPVMGNALHVLSIVDGLRSSGALNGHSANGANAANGRNVLDLDVDAAADVPVLGDSISATVSSLDGVEIDTARALAVLGGSATIEEIAELLSVPPMSLLGPVQRLLDLRVLVEATERVAFSHEAYRDAVYAAAPIPVRRLLHSVAGARGGVTERARHAIAAEAGSDEVVAAVLAAADDLDNAPRVAAELIGDALSTPNLAADAASALAATRARALARAGRLREAGEVATAAQRNARDPAVLTELRRVELFTLTTRARVDEALALVDSTLELPVGEHTRQILTDHRAYLLLLGGRTAVPAQPYAEDPEHLSLNGLVAEALRRCLHGQTDIAVEYAWMASRRYLAADVDPNEGSSADVWLPFVELFHTGPKAGRAALHEMVRLREERGQSWQTTSHQATGGAIDALEGHLSDAAAQLDAALENARRTEFGWTSQLVGWRALVDVLLGDSAGAGHRLAAWAEAPGGVQLGIPQIERARMALLESERRLVEAARVAEQLWTTAQELQLHGWAAMAAPEVARVARRANDEALRARVVHDLGASPVLVGRPLRNARRLALAMLNAEADLADEAVAVARDAMVYEDGLLRLTAEEEAAVAFASSGRRDEARAQARTALATAEDFGARGVSARIAGRMRSAGVRLGAKTARSRPTHGWDSLTPTESLVVDLVSRGLSGPEIARQLHLSPRTVQTHVSHVLAKLNIANRVELAAQAVARKAAVDQT